MSKLLSAILGVSLLATACTTKADSEGVAGGETITGEAKAEQSRPAAVAVARFREATIPSGTTIRLTLTSAIASDTSRVEDAVSARLIQGLMIDRREVVPAGATVGGQVTGAEESGRVKGRAQVAFRFDTLTMAGESYNMETTPLSRIAAATKGEDATKVGIGAGAGAIIGGLLGGKDGAAKGAAAGGGAGAGVVLATRGKEIRLAPGADVTTTLTAPLTVRVRAS